MPFENDPFNSQTIETGNMLSNEIVANPDWANRFYTQQQESAENYQHIVKGLRATSTAMQCDS